MKCIYPGSFDPFTLGHLDIVKRASAVYTKVIVAVGVNTTKKYTLDLNTRINLIRNQVKHLINVEVTQFSGLLVDYAYENNIPFVVKGIRNFQDMDYERMLHEVGVTQQRGIDTQFFLSSPNTNHISSTAVKELCKHNGLLRGYVSMETKAILERELNSQYIIGVTGNIASGKSTFMQKLLNGMESASILHLDLDVIARDILSTSNKPVHVELRKTVMKFFGVDDGTGNIDRKALGNIVFTTPAARQELDRMMWNPMLSDVRQKMFGFRGTIILDGALLVESQFSDLCNNRVIILDCSDDIRMHRLKARGMTDSQAKARIDSQYGSVKKLGILNGKIREDGYGQSFYIKNDDEDYAKVDNICYAIRNALITKDTKRIDIFQTLGNITTL